MKKNLKQLMLLWILGLWLASTLTSAETKSDCFWIADSEAWFGWAVIINYQCFENVIEIPSTIEGKKVTEIWKWAFKNTVLTTVKLPDTLKQIRESAFEDNIIEKIEIPEGVETIDKYAFKNNKLKAIKLPKSLKVIGEEAFYKNNLEKISVPGRLNKVGDNAFCDNVGNEVIWVSDSLEWTWKNSCFKLIKASTVEDTYAGIETDFSTEITEKLWDWIKTDSPEVDELTSALEELWVDDKADNTTDGASDLSWNASDKLEIEEGTWDINDELDDIEEWTGDIEDAESSDDEIISDEEIDDEPSIGVGMVSADDLLETLGWSYWTILAIVSGFFWIIAFIVFLWKIYQALFIISTWEIYKKAWKRWWAFLIPIYGTVVYSEIAETNKWLWIIPWLVPLVVFWLGFLDLWAMVTFSVAGVLSLITLILCIVWNYRIARRFGWSKFASVLNIFFVPITTLFLWLRNDEYQPKKLSYDLNKPQVNEPEKTVPAPVVASEQLNNVVEHFVWPEEETVNETITETVSEPVSEPVSESVVETVAEPITEPVTESTNESTQTENEEIKEESNTSDEVDLTVKNVEEPEWVSEDVDLSLNSESTEDVIASEITAPESSMDNEIDLSNNEGISDEEVNSLQLNLDDEFAQIDDTETPIWEIKTEEENEVILDDKPETEVTENGDAPVEASDKVNEVTEATEAPQGIPEGNVETTEEANVDEVQESSTETILPSLNPELTKDNSENTESNEGQEMEETETDEISEEELVTEPGEEPIAESDEQVEQSMEVDKNESNSSEKQDMWLDTSLFEDMPQDIVDELNKNAQEIENSDSVSTEESTDETQYPDEPISDLDQLMANNNKSL